MRKASYSLWMPEMSSMGPLTGEPVYRAMADSFSNMMAGDMAVAAPAPLLNPLDVSDLQQDWRVDEEELRRLMRLNDQAMDEMLADKLPSRTLLEQSASLISPHYKLLIHLFGPTCDYVRRFQIPTTRTPQRINEQAMDKILADKPPSQMLPQQSASLVSAQYDMPSHVLPSSCGFQSPMTRNPQRTRSC